jgi:hypothetical protein
MRKHGNISLGGDSEGVEECTGLSDDGPTMIVGGHAMSWKDYVAMIREMEKQQMPFKFWIERTFTPAYHRHLGKEYKERTADFHANVAEVFFDRVLHVGFLRYEQIRPAFAYEEFPKWWRSHVIGMGGTTAQVKASVKKLSAFVRDTFDLEIQGVPPKT